MINMYPKDVCPVIGALLITLNLLLNMVTQHKEKD